MTQGMKSNIPISFQAMMRTRVKRDHGPEDDVSSSISSDNDDLNRDLRSARFVNLVL